MIRAAWVGLLLLLIPIAAAACRIAPHLDVETRVGDVTFVPGCEGQAPGNCAVQGIFGAWYSAPTTRYQHAVLGDAVEGGALVVYTTSTGTSSCRTKSITLDASHVFEDISPRIVDLDGDGRAEVITVRSHKNKGAQLAIWGDRSNGPELSLITTTPYIGRSNRWLAPIGAADLDSDGQVEIAYIDRPHLAKTLRIWRFRRDKLTQIAELSGLSNHKIGWDFISGGIRNCGTGPELVLARGDWARVMSVTLSKTKLSARDIGRYSGPESLNSALNCR